ncbi:MAG: nitroreductase [Pseudomonadota bacterium]|nr:nitroreductase [Pseudomonadota bacterium]
MTKDIFASLVSRRSIAKVTDQPVSRSLVERVIEAGTFAPTHKRTDPWRFVVFEGDGRQKLADAMVEGYKQANPDFSAEKLEKIAQKPFRAPVIVMVWCAVGRGKKNPPPWEDYAAVAACLQNMSLAAHGFGLGSIWRSGSLTDFPQVQALCQSGDDSFNLAMGDQIMGLLYIGHPDCNYPEPNRFPNPAQVNWLDS